MKSEEIQKKILQYLKDLDWPSTTGDVARSVKVSWNTAELNLVKLQMLGRVKFKRVGRQNQWWTNKGYKENME